MPLRPFTPAEYLRNVLRAAAAYPGYRRRERADAATLERLSLQRAFAIAAHAARSVPLHRERYRAVGIDLETLVRDGSAAAFSQLPLTAKGDLLADPARGLADGTDPARRIFSTSSGSSGAMLTVPRLGDGFWPHMLSTQRLLAWAAGGHYPAHWRQAYVYTSAYPLPKLPLFYPMRFLPTSADPLESVAALEAYRPAILSTYPSILRDLLAAAPTRMRALALRGVSVGSELSTAAERAGWSDLLGVSVRDEYSSEELGRIASECPAGRMHLHEENVRIELLGVDGLATDGLGEIVGTEFYNTAHPFIRYRQGDLGRISGERCPCGRGGRLLIELQGRQNDGFRLADGRLLAPGFLLDLAYRALIAAGGGTVAAYRLVQTAPSRADFCYVAGPSFGAKTEAVLSASFARELVGVGLELSLRRVDDLARLPSGKRASIVALA